MSPDRLPVRTTLSRLAPALREFRRPAWRTVVFAVLEVLAEISIPLLMADLIDNGIEAGDQAHVVRVGAVLALLAALALIFGVLAGRSAAQAAAGLARNLRSDQFRAVQWFSFGNIDRFSEGSIITRLTTDVTNVQNAFMMIIRIAVRAPSTLVFALAMSFVVAPDLAWVFVAIIPVLAAALYLIATRAHPVFKRVFATYDRLNTTVQENIRGIRVVKASVRGPHEESKFRATSGLIYRDFTSAERILAFNMPSMQLAIYLCLLLVSWIGAHQIVAGSMSTGELVSVISYAMQILMSLMMLSMVLVLATISRASAERIGQVLVEEPTIAEPAQPVQEVADGSIDLRQVGFAYSDERDQDVLTDVTLSIGSGQTIGLLGVTGSGKSSLVQLLPRLYDATSGTVLVGGHDVREYGLGALRAAVSIVLQKNVLFEGSIAENLRWGDPQATPEQLRAATDVAQATGFVEQIEGGFDAHVEQGGANLSGGQRQRLSLARALLARPRILILDDSTSAVDTTTERLIRQGLRAALPGTTKIIIAQRVSSVQDADRIVLLDEGRVVAQGTHEELLAASADYHELYLSQNARSLNHG
ncbi:MAG TPA: ABC transporter ATP-binding protein [Cellulomonas sp.]